MTVVPRFSRTRRRAAEAAAAAALGLVALLPSAGRAAQISEGTWYESIARSCPNTTICTLSFTPIPAGKTLVARNVACRMVTPNNALVTSLSVFGAGTSFIPVGAGAGHLHHRALFLRQRRDLLDLHRRPDPACQLHQRGRRTADPRLQPLRRAQTLRGPRGDVQREALPTAFGRHSVFSAQSSC